MNKQDAFEAMEQGSFVTNRYFSAGEYLWLNKENQVMTEDNYPFQTFWDSNYLPDVEWEIYNN